MNSTIYTREPCDDDSAADAFDFVVVGAGAAGCVLANRLSEGGNWTVLLLEAGGSETYSMSVPYFMGRLQQTEFNWNYRTVPSDTVGAGLDGKINYCPKGKIVGGTTVLNAMCVIRGHRKDFDRWEAIGNTGWGYEGVLPYFRKMEDMQIPHLKNSKYHGRGGPIKIDYFPYQSELSKLVIQAGKEMGYEELDYNGEKMTGFGRVQTTSFNGTRWSASRGYLHPIRHRKNFFLRKRSLVYKILINEGTKTAFGVKYRRDGKSFTVFARREVIVSAGPIAAPQLLMLSGVGPKEHLQKLKIPVIHDLPGVGRNLLNHGAYLGLIFTTDKPLSRTPQQVYGDAANYVDYFTAHRGPLSSVGIETVSFHELKGTEFYSPGYPRFESQYVSSTLIVNRETAGGFRIPPHLYDTYFKPLENKNSFQVYVFDLRPKSVGKLTLADNNIDTPPIIDTNVFGEEEDVKVTIAGIREMIKMMDTPSFKKVGGKLYDTPLPGCETYAFGSDDYWKCAIHKLSVIFYHESGTCKMAPISDKMSVVSPELKVHGIRNLRVIDTSIMPFMVSGHLSVTGYMIGEKGSDLVKKDHYSVEQIKSS
ncbi:Glucose dehydrogenase [FAD, quinone] [Gryllus bimaculatus]|nr:Glucose dehydrogenase [FAD, quinone] [Gryllus bimaculatus]